MKLSLKRTFAAILLMLSLGAPVAADPLADALGDTIRAQLNGDYETGPRLLRPFAEQGYAIAQFRLGEAYVNGKGLPQNDIEAVKWYRLAAEQGYAPAQTNLGAMYARGQGVEQDYRQAVKWYRLAAEQGLLEAQLNLGNIFSTGYGGVPQDYAEAAKWFRLAADQDDADAQHRLGVSYGKGLGVPQDFVQAHMWFNLSAAQGNQDALQARDIVEKSMTPAQIAEAQKLAREWKPTN